MVTKNIQVKETSESTFRKEAGSTLIKQAGAKSPKSDTMKL